ncbi:hypothetical protein ACFC1R_34825 [Kitasatospora sp. NPDC056138]|uniref:hypothetical protein n=1 Tax=Kitasatospora sp. NPDC056138 TaxID=3345724 RepID=UPI0035DA4D93
MTNDDGHPSATTGRLRDALSALGVHGLEHHLGSDDPVFLLGALLAVTETQAGQLDRTELPKAFEGFLQVLLALAGNDPRGAARGWAVVLGDRLSRTAVELYAAVDGGARVVTKVAGPAMLVASSLLNLVNHAEVDQETLSKTIGMAERNLSMACSNLGEMRKTLRQQGFQL